VAIVVFALVKLGVTPGPLRIALFIGAIALGVSIHYAIMVTLATISFWIVRAQGLIYGYFNFFNIARYPDVVFHGFFRVVFSYFITVIIVANVPARFFSRASESPAHGLLQLLGASVFVVIATRVFWLFALKRYSSASS
jgi:ABC-2 type transport system permease protein